MNIPFGTYFFNSHSFSTLSLPNLRERERCPLKNLVAVDLFLLAVPRRLCDYHLRRLQHSWYGSRIGGSRKVLTLKIVSRKVGARVLGYNSHPAFHISMRPCWVELYLLLLQRKSFKITWSGSQKKWLINWRINRLIGQRRLIGQYIDSLTNSSIGE